MVPASLVTVMLGVGTCQNQGTWTLSAEQVDGSGTTLGKAVWDRQILSSQALQATYLDPLGLLVHGLHVIVELSDIGEAGKVLFLLGQEVLCELVQVPVLGQFQQPQVCHLIALKALALAFLPVFLRLGSCRGMGERKTTGGVERGTGSLFSSLSWGLCLEMRQFCL